MKLNICRTEFLSEINQIPPVLRQAYLPSLDGFRAIAIILTIITHVLQTNYGPLGVQVFFVISGFLITTLLFKEKINKGDINLRKFYIRRFFRIIPISWLYVVAVLIIATITQSKVSGLMYLSSTFFLANIINDTWFFAHYWSLSVEEQYYIFFPSIVKYVSIKKYLTFLSLFLIGIIILRFFQDELLLLKTTTSSKNPLHYLNYILFLTKFDGIIVGSFFSVAVHKSFLKVTVPIFWKYFLTIFLPVTIYLVFEHVTKVFAMTVIAVFVSFLIGLNLEPSNDYVFKFLNNSFIRHIGVLSYSLYIWQQLFTYNRPWARAFQYSDNLWLNLVALYVMAYISYNYFEKPFLRFKTRFAS